MTYGARVGEFEAASRFAREGTEYRRFREAAREQHRPSEDPDDPRYIHSEAYGAAGNAEYEVYNRYLNDWIGPGGWTNINVGTCGLSIELSPSIRGSRSW